MLGMIMMTLMTSTRTGDINVEDEHEQIEIKGACLVGGGCVVQGGGLQTAFSNSPIAVGAPITCRPWINVSDIRYFFQDIYDIDFLTFINARRKLKHCHLTEMVRELVSVVETMRPRAKPTMAATTTGFPSMLAVFIAKDFRENF